jgi:hypothetical protein
MTDTEYAGKLDELDRLLNDPDLPMQPARIWDLLADLSHRDLAGSAVPAPGAPRLSRAAVQGAD